MPWSPLPTADAHDGGDPAPLGASLDAVMSSLGAPTVDAIVVIHERWAEVVGAEVADHARPLGIHDGTLRIGADGAAWASHLRWAERDILLRLAALVGPEQIRSVTVRTAPR